MFILGAYTLSEVSNANKSFINQLNAQGENIINVLEDFNNLNNVDIAHEELKKSVEGIHEIISQSTGNITKTISYLIKNVEWNSFNIAFFGETAAGKSTLIEGLVKGDGRSIGEGYKDYTQRLSPKSFGGLYLLDMPGIEGNEKKFIREIQRGIEKAHVVFYVVSSLKGPEEATLRKIKTLLKDRAKVYSILNIMNRPTAYRKYQKELLDKDLIEVARHVQEKCQRVLKGHYVGHLNINAYLGFLTKGTLKRDLFIKDRTKTIDIFSSLEAANNFSRLGDVVDLINKLCSNGANEILISNTYKLIKDLEDTISKIITNKKDFDKGLKDIADSLSQAVEESRETVEKYNNSIELLINQQISIMEKEMIQAVYEGVDKEYDQETIENLIIEIKKQFAKDLEVKIKGLLEEMREEVEELLEHLDNRVMVSLNFRNFEGTIDIAAITEKLKISFKYVLDQIVDIGMSIWGIVIAFAVNPILGAIAAVVAVLRKIWDWFFGDPAKRSREAKKEARAKIKQAVKCLQNEYVTEMKKELKSLTNKMESQIKDVNVYINSLWKASALISAQIQKLNEIKNEVFTALAVEVLGNNVIWGAIDLKLNQMMIIGINIKKEDLTIFRMHNANAYEAFDQFIIHVAEKNGDAILVKDNEFAYRIISSIKDALSIKTVKKVSV